jgi:hypothetical protein
VLTYGNHHNKEQKDRGRTWGKGGMHMAEATNRKITTGDGWNIPSKYLPEAEYRDLPDPLFRGGFASHGLLGSNSGGYLRRCPGGSFLREQPE